MGIRVEVSDLSNECPLCFPIGETPTNVWMTIQGVKTGTTWVPAYGNAPNGVVKLANDGGCVWVGEQLSFAVIWIPGFSSTFFSIRLASTPWKFDKTEPTGCSFFGTNGFTSSSLPFYDGFATISFTKPAIGPSITNVMDKMNMAVEAGTFAEVFPVDSDTNVYRIARKRDATNVKIKFDF